MASRLAAVIESWLVDDPEDARDRPAAVGSALSAGSRPTSALVSRQRLLRGLGDLDGPPVVVLAAPAGYGKTTLLRQWRERDKRPFSWVTLDDRHNEPRRLLASVRREVATAVSGDGAVEPFVLVLDDVQALHDRRAINTLNIIVAGLPPQARLAIASRVQPELPVARLRAQRDVTELGARELAMTHAEATALLRAEGHEIGREGVDALLARTEGWPAALSLASLFLTDSGIGALQRFGGADRLVSQYVRAEVLSCLSEDRLDFMLRTSIAGTLTAPLCDALVGRPGSAATLATLMREGLVVALDRIGECFRYHRLLAESLHVELRLAAPALEPELHLRASAWHHGAGDIDRAIEHALRAGAVGEAAHVVWRNLAPMVAQGRTGTVERWLGRFTSDEIAEHAMLASTAAGCALLRGQGHIAEHWIARAEATAGRAPVTLSWVALLRAVIGSSMAGTHSPTSESGAAQSGDAAVSVLRALLDGVSRRHAGDREGAAKALEAGARRAAVTAPAVHALCLAELAVIDLDQNDWKRAAALVDRARAQVDRHGLADHAAMALVFAVSALVLAHRGSVEAARSDLREAVALRDRFTDVPPSADTEVSLMVARAALRLGDVTTAREHLEVATRRLGRLPGAIGLRESASDVAVQLDAATNSVSVAPSFMTAAELRILQYLPTHLSFREIGELGHVSANTVKTQANAVYRKLGASCRSEAVTRARGCGMLDGAELGVGVERLGGAPALATTRFG